MTSVSTLVVEPVDPFQHGKLRGVEVASRPKMQLNSFKGKSLSILIPSICSGGRRIHHGATGCDSRHKQNGAEIYSSPAILLLAISELGPAVVHLSIWSRRGQRSKGSVVIPTPLSASMSVVPKHSVVPVMLSGSMPTIGRSPVIFPNVAWPMTPETGRRILPSAHCPPSTSTAKSAATAPRGWTGSLSPVTARHSRKQVFAWRLARRWTAAAKA